LYHLQNVSSAFVHDLSNRVDVKEYSQKLFSMAEREEAWSGDNLIGLVAYYINHDTQKAFITNVSVDIRFQKQGIATKLLENAKCVAIEERMKLISLEAANDDELIAFYLHNGFSLHKRVMDSNSELIMHLVPMVVIRCTVYNHEPYLRDCLEGFVMQQTNFPFVAIVHDDASTDGSAAIIREYEEKYPDIIKPIYETENQYSKRDGSLGRIMSAAIEATGAKYVAMCEGDDYWTDPLKLQKQVDFMEANPEYSMCFHKVNTMIQETGEIKNEFILTGIVKANGEHLEIEVINSDYAFGIYWVLTFDETEFLNKSGEKITKNDISIGDMVEITYGGQTMLSYPPQIVAQRVKITHN
jgi:GNAT superfamily N-acetyltransferase